MKKILILGILGTIMQCCSFKAKEEVESTEYPLLETMGYYQRFSHKLWLAGNNENWELANFYVHELEEVTEDLIKNDFIDEGKNLSNLSESLLKGKIEKMEEAVRLKDQVIFRENYKLMISACNLCHQATNHPYLKMKVPDEKDIFNQSFE